VEQVTISGRDGQTPSDHNSTANLLNALNLPLTKVDLEMLKILQQKDRRYRQGLLNKIQQDLKEDYDRIRK